MTTSHIFTNGQLLTLEAAKSLIGKKIACTSREYKHNTPRLVEFIVSGFISDWDLAANEPMEKYGNRQNYWASYMSQEQVQERKDKLHVLGEDGKTKYNCHTASREFDEPTFSGSDMDRPVLYIEL